MSTSIQPQQSAHDSGILSSSSLLAGGVCVTDTSTFISQMGRMEVLSFCKTIILSWRELACHECELKQEKRLIVASVSSSARRSSLTDHPIPNCNDSGSSFITLARKNREALNDTPFKSKMLRLCRFLIVRHFFSTWYNISMMRSSRRRQIARYRHSYLLRTTFAKLAINACPTTTSLTKLELENLSTTRLIGLVRDLQSEKDEICVIHRKLQALSRLQEGHVRYLRSKLDSVQKEFEGLEADWELQHLSQAKCIVSLEEKRLNDAKAIRTLKKKLVADSNNLRTLQQRISKMEQESDTATGEQLTEMPCSAY